MDLQLDGKLVVVTGSTKGIGRAIAEKYLQVGSDVVINGRTQNTVEKVVKELQALKKGHVYGFAADLSSAEGVNQLLSKVKEIGQIDILVNNTGIYYVKPFETTTDEEWYNYFNTNVMSTVRLCRAVFPQMLKRNTGNIVNISSVVAFMPIGSVIAYSMTKAAQVNISRGLAELTKGTKVRVNSLIVGVTQTEGVDDFFTDIGKSNNTSAEESKASLAGLSLLNRPLTAEEIANICVFSSSPIAAAITGSAINVDGGAIAHI